MLHLNDRFRLLIAISKASNYNEEYLQLIKRGLMNTDNGVRDEQILLCLSLFIHLNGRRGLRRGSGMVGGGGRRRKKVSLSSPSVVLAQCAVGTWEM